MKYTNTQTQLFEIIPLYDNNIYKNPQVCKVFTFIWVADGVLEVTIDNIPRVIPKNSMLCISPNQNVSIKKCELGQYLLQYNREFYCIIQHDKEVSCAGLLFFSPYQNIVLSVNDRLRDRLNTLLQILEEEFRNNDSLQGEMLRILLKRLIITCTRLAKKQLLLEDYNTSELDLFRHFSILVEQYFIKEHSVHFYAEQLHKAPKTLSNQFAILKVQTPIEIIHQRIILEAKRLITYTQLSFSEIAFELGYEELAHFSRFFKNHTSFTPSEYRKSL